jgi:hypothetical protein
MSPGLAIGALAAAAVCGASFVSWILSGLGGRG